MKNRNLFDYCTCPEDYEQAGVIPIEPMTAKEVMEKDLGKVLTSKEFIAEEKLDGVRGNLRFMKTDNKKVNWSHVRVFTRRISKKTNFYGEKSDSLTHLRDLSIPELNGTVLDGEMKVIGKDFETVSSILNCLPEEARERQKRDGYVTFMAFDIIYYKGKYVGDEELIVRKRYLSKAMEIIHRELTYANTEYIEEIPWFTDSVLVDSIKSTDFMSLKRSAEGELKQSLETATESERTGMYSALMSKKAFFDYIVRTGGEGIMVKDIHSIYEQKRTRAYQKIKKKIYRDVVILAFSEPTMKYEGKMPKDKWNYWINHLHNRVLGDNDKASDLLKSGLTPVTKNYFEHNIGGIIYGVSIAPKYKKKLEKSKKKFQFIILGGVEYVVVGECEGIDDSLRKDMSLHLDKYIGTVFEVEGNEMFYDTGKIRHPRYFRARPDKEPKRCTWREHVNE